MQRFHAKVHHRDVSLADHPNLSVRWPNATVHTQPSVTEWPSQRTTPCYNHTSLLVTGLTSRRPIHIPTVPAMSHEQKVGIDGRNAERLGLVAAAVAIGRARSVPHGAIQSRHRYPGAPSADRQFGLREEHANPRLQQHPSHGVVVTVVVRLRTSAVLLVERFKRQCSRR